MGNLYGTLNLPPAVSPEPIDIIDTIFKDGDDETLSNKVRYINVVKTSIDGKLAGMFVANETCNLFVNIGSDIRWYAFSSSNSDIYTFVQYKVQSDSGDYVVEPKMQFTKHPISSEGWLFKMLNRDFVGTSRINDAFAIHCEETSETEQPLWYVPQLDVYIYGAESTGGILDMAYEQYGDRLYVLFNGDNHLYAYDSIA